ncbi:hypothetical protein BOW52_02655 [Solemya elarraichensis gill symbiont]|uniref:Cytochrome c domain-containing protein n=1 Tax=Solemya elarraichensis gill symbiont TaxID=1918949 RepID=A0A1T2LC66_9GAMM|nr:hypothetical protein BOW52_02655 [Solemya elarraichensis gill symbiont]
MCLLTVSGYSFAQDDHGVQAIGQMEFQKNCASCHGMDGKSGGSFVEFLKVQPTDLTTISQRNGGIFPHQKVYMLIREPEGAEGHGTLEMPVWGDRYSQEIIDQYGPDYTGPGGSVNERILELVFFLLSIQE